MKPVQNAKAPFLKLKRLCPRIICTTNHAWLVLNATKNWIRQPSLMPVMAVFIAANVMQAGMYYGLMRLDLD